MKQTKMHSAVSPDSILSKTEPRMDRTVDPVLSRKNQLAFVFITFALLGLVVPLQLFSGITQGEASFEFFLCVVVLECSALRIAILTAGAPRFLTMTFYFYIYIWIGWSGSIQTYLWKFPWPVVHSREDLAIALGQIILAIIFYELGLLLAQRRLLNLDLWRIKKFDHQLSLNRLALLWLFSFVGFAYGIVYFGLDGVLGTRKTFGASASASSTQIDFIIARSLLRAPCFVTFLASAHLILHGWREFSRSNKRLLILILMTSATLTFIANYPPAVARSWLGAVLMAPVMLLAPWGRRASIAWVLALMFILTWVYPRADMFRYSSTLDEALRRLERQEEVRAEVMSVDYSELQMTANCYVYTKYNDFMWGNNLLSATLFFVPRAVWPTKAQRSDLLVANAIGYRQKNLSADFWSEAYMAFGLPGLALMLLLYGYVSRWYEQRYVLARLQGQIMAVGPLALLVPFWGAYQFYFLRGNLITAIAYSALPIALMWYLYPHKKHGIPLPTPRVTDRRTPSLVATLYRP